MKFTIYTTHTYLEPNHVSGIVYSNIIDNDGIQYEKYSLSYSKISDSIKRIFDCNFTSLKHYTTIEQYDSRDSKHKHYHWDNNYHSYDIHYGCLIEKHWDERLTYPCYRYGENHAFYSAAELGELTNIVGEYNIVDVKNKLTCSHMSDSEFNVHLKKGVEALGLKQSSYFGFWNI